MSFSTSKVTGNIEIKLTGYHDCDDVQLFWRVRVDGQLDGVIPNCLGFMIERQRKTKEGTWSDTEVLRNRVGFSDQENKAAVDESGSPSKNSNIWPFQRYEWTDHGANNGETVRYRVSAVGLSNGGVPGITILEPIADTGWTESIAVSADCGNGLSAYFNRGFVISQFIARIMRMNGWKAKDIKEKVEEVEEPLRRFLSGELRIALLGLLNEAIDNPGLSLYAALYELLDEEIIGQLKLLHGRAHLLLSNGSDKKGDENKASRDVLKEAGADIHDRMLGNKGLGHNKFAVLVRTSDGKALKVWTGSTNWAPTGLCTQVNNGILIENEDIAKIFLDQWQRLADAGNEFSKALVDSNTQSPRTSGNIDVWFTRERNTSKADLGFDLRALVDLVNDAKQLILYIMFAPGSDPLGSILRRASDISVNGVANNVLKGTAEKFELMGVDKNSSEYKTALVVPEGIAKDFSAWITEVTRSQFTSPSGIGHAITHSKIIVIDPFSDDCKVITGSHNFSKSASEKNDENLIVIHGNKDLAEAYAVECLATYDHYRWRAYVKEITDAGKVVWSYLSKDPKWQEDYLSAERKKHLDIWCR